MTMFSVTSRARIAGALAIVATVAVALLLARGTAEAQQSPWPTRQGEKWVLAGPFAVDVSKGRHAINLATINGSVRGVRVGVRDKGMVLTGVGMRYADGKTADVTRRITLNPRERTRMLAGTAEDRFLDGIDLVFAPGARAQGPVLVEIWLLQSAAGAVALRPAPAPKAAAAAPKPAAPAAQPAPKVSAAPKPAPPPPAAKPAPANTPYVVLPPLPPPPTVVLIGPLPKPAASTPPIPRKTGFTPIPSAKLWPMLFEAWGTSSPEWQARLVQDETMQECFAHANIPPKALANAIQKRELERIEYPADGKFIGDWKKGEALAQSGYGLRFTDKNTKRPNGGNCYACHQLSSHEVSYGTVGPSLQGYGKLRKFDPAEAKLVYERIFNPQSALACANMPRFGTNGILSIEQIKDLVALLMDPESPVNK